MASSSTEATSAPSADVNQFIQQAQPEEPSSSQHVEMSQLASQQPPNPPTQADPSSSDPQPSQDSIQSPSSGADPTTSAISTSTPPNNDAADSNSPSIATAPVMKRKESSAIGPSQDNPVLSADPASGPMVLVTLLLITGARHPYKIDEKYLRRRNVVAPEEEADPFGISVYTMKELIWRDWREEWEMRPTSPSYIRLIHFGRLLDDKTPLRDCRFNPTVSNVVHMTVKPQDIIDEEENAKAGKGSTHRDRDDTERQGGLCRCVIL